MTFRSQGSKALRAYNQYYIFHCHLHSYCKWLVSKIITGCIKNLGFAISPPVLGGLRLSPSVAPAPLGVNDAAVADTSHTDADFFFLPFSRTPLCTPPHPATLHILYLFTLDSAVKKKKWVCVRKRLRPEMISPL